MKFQFLHIYHLERVWRNVIIEFDIDVWRETVKYTETYQHSLRYKLSVSIYYSQWFVNFLTNISSKYSSLNDACIWSGEVRKINSQQFLRKLYSYFYNVTKLQIQNLKHRKEATRR